MRVFIALAAVGGVLAALEGPARATSCGPSPWFVQSFGGDAVPVDFHPWLHMSCPEQSGPAAQLGACTIETTGQSIAATIEASGSCEPMHDPAYGYSPAYVAYLVPAAPLMPGWTYRLVCSELPDADWTFTTRASAAPASAPEAVSAKVRYRQNDEDGCCSAGDYLVMDVVDRDAPFIKEGGLIEVGYPTGEVVPVDDEALRGELVLLPPSLGPLELTPVAANGTRGPTTRIERGDLFVEPVYIPCAVSRGSTSLALWLLGPLLWIGTRGRRRRAR